MVCKCFLSCHRLPIHSVDCVLWCPGVLNFDSLIYYIFFFCCLCFWHHIQEIIVKSALSSALNEWLCQLLHWETMSPAPVTQSSFSLSVGEGSFSYPLPTPSLEEKEQMLMAKEERDCWPKRKWSAVARRQPCLGPLIGLMGPALRIHPFQVKSGSFFLPLLLLSSLLLWLLGSWSF